jgi:hypothetical protein
MRLCPLRARRRSASSRSLPGPRSRTGPCRSGSACGPTTRSGTTPSGGTGARPASACNRLAADGRDGGTRREETAREWGGGEQAFFGRTTDDGRHGGWWGRGVEAFPVSTKHARAPRRRLKRNRRAAPEGGGHAPRTTTRGLECVVLSGGISLGRSTRDSTGIRTTRHEGPSERETTPKSTTAAATLPSRQRAEPGPLDPSRCAEQRQWVRSRGYKKWNS